MIKAPIPANDTLRLQDLYSLGILDTPEEDEFSDIVELASRICKTPISLISLVDYSRQWFKAKVGINATETPRDISFCGHAIVMDNDFFEVPDAMKDIRFLDNPLVTGEPNIRYYAGVQLISKKGFHIGMLCVNDTKPNKLTDEQIFALKVLGNHVAKLLDLRITKKQSDEKSKKIESQNEVLQRMLSIIAHDVRGPIGSLKQIFELSEANMLDPTSKQELLNLSKFQIDNVLTLLNNLVEWGKIKLEDRKNGNEHVKVKATVDHEINNISLAATLKNNTVLNLVEESVELHIDPDMLQFIIRNLLTNANKFTKEGKIIIFSDRDEQYTKLTLNDTGIGMTKQMVENLLQKNDMVTTPGTNNEKGSGIGFKLIKEFMENIGGKIEITSEVGKGTSVNLYFPNKKINSK
jgi:signal transduction histidine kinase